MNSNKIANPIRDPAGKYSNPLDAVCKCGQTKGAHSAAYPYVGLDFRCPYFRKVR